MLWEGSLANREAPTQVNVAAADYGGVPEKRCDDARI
jgi:hypothetical protein